MYKLSGNYAASPRRTIKYDKNGNRPSNPTLNNVEESENDW